MCGSRDQILVLFHKKESKGKMNNKQESASFIKGKVNAGGGGEREKKGERGGNCLVQVSWLSILLNVKAGMAFQLAS